MRGSVRCETGLVNAVVDVVVYPLVHLFDVLPQVLREQVQLLMLVVQEVVKGIVEHANDLAALVADNALLFLVIQRWHSKTAFVVRVLLKVDVAQMREIGMDRIRCNTLAGKLLVCSREPPALTAHVPVYAREGDNVLQAFQISHNQSPMRPGACV
jgi:hypothetical protein